MSLEVSYLVQQVNESPTIEIKRIADEMKGNGEDIYDFGVGEMNPEIPVPMEFKEGIIASLMNNETHYNSPQGDPRLRKAIQEDYKRNFNLDIKDENIIVFEGPKDSLFKACMAILSTSRNRVIAFAPVYESFTAIPFLLTGQPTILLPTTDEFMPELEELEKILQEDQKYCKKIGAIILNSPNNPSGAVYSQKVIKEIADIMVKYPEVAILSDEVYRTINYTEEDHFSIYKYLPDQTIISGGISKEVSGTGLRLGFLIAAPHIVKGLIKLQGNTSSCACLPIERGFAHFLEIDKDMKIRKNILNILKQKREIILNELKTNEAFKDCIWTPPKGAFYFFPKVTKYFGRKTENGIIIRNDQDLAIYILKSFGVVTIPGSKFEKHGYLRIAFAASPNDRIKEGINRIGKALQSLKE